MENLFYNDDDETVNDETVNAFRKTELLSIKYC